MAPPIHRFPLQVQLHLYGMEVEKLPPQTIDSLGEHAHTIQTKIAVRQLRAGLYHYHHPNHLVELQDCLAEDIGLISGIPLKTVSHLIKPFTSDPLRQLNLYVAETFTRPAYDQLALTLATFKKKDSVNFNSFCQLQSDPTFSKKEQMEFLRDALPSYGKEFNPTEKEAQQIFDEVREEILGHYTVDELINHGNSLESPTSPDPMTIKKGFRFYRSLKEIEAERMELAKVCYNDVGETIRLLDSHQNPDEKSWQDVGKLWTEKRNVATVRRWLSDQLSPKEKREALEKIYQKPKTPEEKARAKRALEVDHAQQVYGILHKTDQGAATILEAMDNAGFPIPPKVRQSVNLGRAVLRTMASVPMMIVNPFDGIMGMVKGVGEIIGITRHQGPSLGDLRHQEILDGIQTLQQGQQEILMEQYKTQEMIRVLGSMQAETMEMIQALDKKLDGYMQIIDTKLDHLLWKIGTNTQILVEESILERFSSVHKLRIALECRTSFDPTFNHFSTYEALYTFTKEVGSTITDGMNALSTSLGMEKEATFALTTDNQYKLHQHFNQLTHFLLLNFDHLTLNRERGFAALMYPSKTTDCLKNKKKQIEKETLTLPGLPLQYISLPNLWGKGFLSYPYLFQRIHEYALCAIRFHPLYQYFEGDKLLPLEEVGEAVKEEGLSVLQSMEGRISAALIHQSLLAGDFLLPLLYEDFKKDKDKVIKLTASNPTLSHNFMVFAFQPEFSL